MSNANMVGPDLIQADMVVKNSDSINKQAKKLEVRH